MAPSVTIVLPMRNEEAYFHRALRAAREILSEITGDYEIVIVDDASTDATPRLADALSAEDPHVKVVHNRENLKLGGTLRAGWAVASKDLVMYTDTDLPFDLQELGRAVRLLEYQQADLLTAFRFDRTTEGIRRTIYSFSYNWLIRALFGLKLKDVNFSFKLS